jgi:uncharacterized membrane protein (UPF0127 family)
MKLIFTYKNKTIPIDVKKCGWIGKIIGLMFSRREKARALLLFDFKKPVKWGIHSLFVFFPFFAVWLDDKNKVVDLRLVKPFTLTIHSKRPFHKLVEIPINKRYSKLIGFLVGTKDLNIEHT